MNALPTIKQLQYFIALSEQLNFTQAADACFVTQSTLSVGIKQLEEVLGVQLFERDKQNVLLTDAGAAVVERAYAALTSVNDFAEAAIRAHDPLSGDLTLGVIPTIAPFLLPVLTKKAEAQLPKLRLILREDVTASLLEQLRQGEIDLAIIALPYDIGNLLAISLYDDELRLVAQKGDPLATKKNLKADTSLLDRLVLLEEGHCLREHALYACSKPQNQESPGLHATSLLTILGMVEAGLGVSLIPEMAINNGMLGKRDLVTKQFSGTKPKRTIALVTRKSTSRLIAINALADILRF